MERGHSTLRYGPLLLLLLLLELAPEPELALELAPEPDEALELAPEPELALELAPEPDEALELDPEPELEAAWELPITGAPPAPPLPPLPPLPPEPSILVRSTDAISSHPATAVAAPMPITSAKVM